MRLGFAGFAFVLTMLPGCSLFGDTVISRCDDHIKSTLRSPSTYKRISVSTGLSPISSPKEAWVNTTYDAANAYGTPIRETASCYFKLKAGRVDLESIADESMS